MKQHSSEVGAKHYWRKRVFKAASIVVVVAAVLLVVFSLISPVQTVSNAPSFRMVQDSTPDVSVLPQSLERLSWGAVLAGAIMALAIQISINLLAVRMGAGSFNPRDDYDADLKQSVMNTAVWVGVGTLIAMFVGGWIAGRFAGIPEGVDGMLHGLMVWAVVTLISLAFLGSAVGRLLGGISSLVGRGIQLAGHATEVVAKGAVDVAQGAAHMAKDAVSGAAHAVQDVAEDAAHTSKDAASGLRGMIEKAVDSSPELKDAMEQIDLVRSSIESEARRMIREAGVAPDQIRQRVKDAAEDVAEDAVGEARKALTGNGEVTPAQMKAQAKKAVSEVKSTAKDVVQQVAEDPEEALQALNMAMRRVFYRGRLAVNDVDRDALVDLLVDRTNMSEVQARETLAQWENRVEQAKREVETVREELQQRLEQLQSEAEIKAKRLESEVREKAEEARAEAERVAREAAQATSDAVAQIAGVVFAAVVIGGIAAGIGGWIGTPERLPTVEVGTEGTSTENHLQLTSASFFFADFE
jgi:ElaB/YqjD/DUF883 family membrane-anchored ribosome-binding protein